MGNGAEPKSPEVTTEEWLPTDQYAARIGGIIYRSVKLPIVVNGMPVLALHRNVKTDELGISFELCTQDGASIAKIEHNDVVGIAEGYMALEGQWGKSVVEKANGRVWYDLRKSPIAAEYEIDCSCLLFAEGGYPLFLHPDRTCLGSPHGSNPPNVSSLTLTTDQGSEVTAISSNGAGFYIIGIIGIDIMRGAESDVA